MNLFRTDLAAEAAFLKDTPKNLKNQGVDLQKEEKNGLLIERVQVKSEEGAAFLGRAKGNYVTLSGPRFAGSDPTDLKADSEVLAKEIQKLLPPGDKVLAVGLGNPHVTADALGPKTVEKLFVTRHLYRYCPEVLEGGAYASLSALAPGVMGQTGLETAETVAALIETTGPDYLIVIDALAAGSLSRLGTTVQLTDTGIAPGAGVGNDRLEMSEKTLGIPVIALGVPTVADAISVGAGALRNLDRDLSEDEIAAALSELDLKDGERAVICRKNIDSLIGHMASLLALGLNRALHPALQGERAFHFLG